jgi:hypothetical protein
MFTDDEGRILTADYKALASKDRPLVELLMILCFGKEDDLNKIDECIKAHGSDVNVAFDVYEQDVSGEIEYLYRGVTPFLLAFDVNHFVLAKVLLTLGANPDKQDGRFDAVKEYLAAKSPEYKVTATKWWREQTTAPAKLEIKPIEPERPRRKSADELALSPGIAMSRPRRNSITLISPGAQPFAAAVGGHGVLAASPAESESEAYVGREP